ncbi:MAG: L-lysine 6-transaminase [Candidatus Coatesbacteria bacterium]|nr:L-lysine 6-transaminase [Candidatus Coatesbacteria bacterium]
MAITKMSIPPADVHETLGKHMLVDGFDLVVDLQKSKGSRLYDSRRNRDFLDMFSFFASNPLGMNHPALADKAFLSKLTRAAVHKPSNSDIYTVEMAEFVETFGELAMPRHTDYLFFIEGGGLAIENALKAAFDWKIRKNFKAGSKLEVGTQVLHFREAFHGRTGYTLSLTNTEPVKIEYFPKFNWPRIENPKITFPLEGENLAAVKAAEERALSQIEQAFASNRGDIAAIIIEPVQGEGGDNHFRAEFMQALRKAATDNDAMLIFDEIQTGLGLTGKMWCFEHFGVKPDMVCFGKKSQVCGVACSKRIDEVPDNVFKVSGRINSTWGGNLVDMVRCQKFLEVIKEENLIENAAGMGARLLEGLRSIQGRFSAKVQNARGLGLMCAFNLANTELRDKLFSKTYDNGLIVLKTGARGIRFRPALNVTPTDIDEALDKLGDSLTQV